MVQTLVVALVVLFLGCAADSPTREPRARATPSAPSGAVAGSGAAPEDSDDSGFGNAPPSSAPAPDAEPVVPPAAPRDCNPGFYLGTYSCELILFGFPSPLEGDVSFNLSVNESVTPTECVSNEFCADLVIEENSGTLFGLAGFYGFETVLDGALDCTKGEFRATGLGGKWGTAISTDPNDPQALWTVEDPPLGMFDGDLAGTHEAGPTEAIAGTWNLVETATAITCNGPFRVELQP